MKICSPVRLVRAGVCFAGFTVLPNELRKFSLCILGRLVSYWSVRSCLWSSRDSGGIEAIMCDFFVYPFITSHELFLSKASSPCDL